MKAVVNYLIYLLAQYKTQPFIQMNGIQYVVGDVYQEPLFIIGIRGMAD